MNLRQHPVSLAAALLGVVVVAAHLALGLLAVITLGQWVSGAGIGVAVVVLASAHLLAGHHGRQRE